MRRLTLILSDLYLPEDASDTDTAQAHALPSLEWLLGMSDAPQFIGDWRAWLLAGAGNASNRSVMEFVAAGMVDDPASAGAWFATPVALESRLDHVRLQDRGLLRIDAAARAALCAEFARVFGPQFLLHEGGERGFFLTGLAPTAARSVDPARLLGADIGDSLPARAAEEVRRLGAEIEMWLHGSDFNAQLERARRRRVSNLWLWRGAARDAGPISPLPADAEFFGSDPLIDALSRRALGRAQPAPDGYAGLAESAHAVVELAPLSGGASENLPALETRWFEPAGAALLAGALDAIDIVANDRRFVTERAARMRFWRRRRHWLARLGEGSAAKA